MRPALLTATLLASVAAPFAPPLPAQGPSTPPARVGVFLWHDSPNDATTLDGVREGLAEAHVAVEFVERQADADPERAARCLAELRGAGCDLVLALGTRATQLAREAMPDRPIVFAAVTNPVASDILPAWGPSGVPLCGASNWIDPQGVLDVFRMAVPQLRRLGMLRSRQSGVVSQAELTDMRALLARPGAPAITVHEAFVDGDGGLDGAVKQLLEAGVDAIWIPIDLTVYSDVPAVEHALGERRVPLLTTAASGVRGGALVGAAVDYRLHGRRAAALLQRALRHPDRLGEWAVDRMQSSLVVVNLAAARRNGFELPLSLLAIADELIAPEAPQEMR
ncbi:MAG: ABC transporter substrate-binding protein [Planctomycetes bacterium]|nr:ABC transporter substrate-binding protein [Planctomycetota bacterium]